MSHINLCNPVVNSTFKSMNNLDAMMSSATAEWGTPQDFFNRLDALFHFTLDPCATAENHKCERYFTKEIDGLIQPWLGRVFMNPPYGREIPKWMEKAESESRVRASLVVCLVPARTDTRWFQRALKMSSAIVFLPGRLTFEGAEAGAPFPSALIIYGALPSEINTLGMVTRTTYV